MARVVLVQALPRDPATGATIAVRLAGGGARAYDHLGKADWLDGIVSEPLFASQLGFSADGWTGAAVPQTAALGYAPASRERVAALALLVWPGADILVLAGDDATASPSWEVLLKGKVAGCAIKAGVLAWTIGDLSQSLRKPLVTGTFAGTGGSEGVVAAAGRVKRRSWGRVFNVEGRLLDSATNVYEFGDPSHPIQAFVSVKDKGRGGPLVIIAWQGSVDATLSALKAASAPQGGAAVAPSIACAKWCTQPSTLTADLLGEIGSGYVESPAAIAAAMIASISSLAVEGLDAANTARPDPAGWHVDSATATCGDALDGLLFGASLVWAMSVAGTVQISPISFDAPIEIVDCDSIERAETFAPVNAVRLTYALNNRIMSDGEISAAVLAGDITGLGPLATAPSIHFGSPLLLETDGGAAASLSDFKTALGVASAIAGQSTWATYSDLAPDHVSGQVRYLQNDGRLQGDYVFRPGYGSIVSYWPEEAGANVTEGRTAAALLGQSEWATLTDISPAGVYGPNPNLLYNGGFKLQLEGWSVSGWSWIDGASNEGPYIATGPVQNAVCVATSATIGGQPGATIALQGQIFAAGQTSGRAYLRIVCFRGDGSLSTDPYVAYAFAQIGQGWAPARAIGRLPGDCVRWAVQAVIDGATTSNTAIRQIKASGSGLFTTFSDEATTGAVYADGKSIRGLQPQEAGANATEGRIAAAVDGQGTLATKSIVETDDVARSGVTQTVFAILSDPVTIKG